MWRCCLAVVAAACGRIGFDSNGDAGTIDMIAPRCSGPALATDPPASGGGIQLVRAFGDAPNAPTGTPTQPTVDLAWEARQLQPGARYVVVRAECGNGIDATTMEPCTSTTTGSCRVCATTSRLCADASAPPSPARVRYRVAIEASGSILDLPDDDRFVVDVAIPPPNMVLLHRGTVNREMCDLIGGPTDQANHHRCAYAGPGGVPKRAHPDSADLNLPVGFYDFGYDLFVDRWEAACNWTLTGGGAPPATGATGDVFYTTGSGRCFVKRAEGWSFLHDAAATDPAAAAHATTNDPGPNHDRPPLGYLDVFDVAAICGNIDAPGYGRKRPWRLRELVAAGAFARLPEDVSPVLPAAIQEIEAGMAHPTTRACNVNLHDGVTPTGFGSGDELARDIVISGDPAEAPEHFVIGSVATSRCVSRYGVQDLIGNVDEVVSDTFAACGTGTPCVGAISLVDAGNQDLLGLRMDGTTGVGPTFTQQPLESAARVALPLAMPLVASAPFGNPPVAAQLRSDILGLYTEGAVRERMGIAGGGRGSGVVAGRFTTDFGGSPDGGNIDVTWGARCVVAAIPR